MIRVAVDARVLSGQAERAGIAQYVAQILQAGDGAEDMQVTALSYESRQLRENAVPVEVIRRVRGVPWQSVLLPWYLAHRSFDVFHGPAFSIPPWVRAKRVVTVHDLAFLRMPSTVRADTVRYLRQMVKRSVAQASAIIVPSREVQADLQEMFPRTDPARIRVIPLGADRLSGILPGGESLQGLPYFLHVGTVEPRKNLTFLLRAYAQAVRGGHLPHHLVLAGSNGWNNEDFWQAYRSFDMANRVHILGYVDDARSVRLYQEAAAYVQPSLYEGFGLGAFEALGFGCPVVATPTGGVLDVNITGLDIVPAGDPDLWAQAMIRAVERPALPLGGRLPTWQGSRRAHQALYREVARP